MSKPAKWIIGGVYRVERREVVLKRYKREGRNLPDHYYCTVIKNPNFGKDMYKFRYANLRLVAYIPNEIIRALDDGDGCHCNLEGRMNYIGSFETHGHLLFNQQLPWHSNEFDTNFVFEPTNPILIQ